MKKIRHLSMLVSILFAILLVLSACGKSPDNTESQSASAAETTVVLSTTADGNTIEQDSDGNTITKDSDGKVVSVVDKSGNQIEVSEYLSTHSWVENNIASGSGSTEKAGDSTIGSQEEMTEGDIPVIIATIPDEDDVVELPDL